MMSKRTYEFVTLYSLIAFNYLLEFIRKGKQNIAEPIVKIDIKLSPKSFVHSFIHSLIQEIFKP